MKVVNTGEGLVVDCSYDEAVIITQALRESAAKGDHKSSKLLDEMLNEQIIEVNPNE